MVVETLNGIAHSAIAIARGGYFPGVATAPLLLAWAPYLGIQMSRRPD